MTYYNEIEPFAAQWIRNLIAAGHIAAGDVDERPIQEVRPHDLDGYTQCHFFAGIGGWSLALRLAGWPDDRPVWTGSCPCQPFSSAGNQKGQTDHRHLWPVWFRLIRELKPSVVFGEQVANAIAFGWLDEVACDLEGENYVFGAAVLPACSVGAPHRRNRLFFMADCQRKGLSIGVFELENQGTVESSSKCRGRYGYSIGSAWDGEPELAVLVHGFPSDMAASNAYGNAIVPQVAAEFIAAYMEAAS